jgi:HlyD family secretion protein
MSVTCPSLKEWHKDVKLSNRRPVMVGFAVLFTCIFGFGLWAGLAPIEGAVVASGSFVALGQNKQVQHLEGGILKTLHVDEGEMVEAGQILLTLDDTAVTARLRRLVLRRYRLLAARARLEAEIYGRAEMDVPEALAKLSGTTEIAEILSRQRIELDAKRAKLNSEQNVLRKEIAGLQQSIIGFEARTESTRSRMELFQQELKDKTALLDRQLTRKSEVLAIRRSEAGLSGELGELIARVADSRERIARAEQQIEALSSAAIQRAITELRETETELDDVAEQIRAARNVVERIEVRAPVKGIVVSLNQSTIGGVIAPGGVILELLPINDELIIEARVKPQQVSYVRNGQEALVRLTAFNQRVTPMIEARVVYLSADTVSERGEPDQASSAPQQSHSFVVRARLDKDDAYAKVPDFLATPGMPADIFIKTEERTFFDYIVTPVTDVFARAFREQ